MTILCASFRCPADTPFRCTNNDCVKTFEECGYGFNLFVAKKFDVATHASLMTIAINSNDKSNHFLAEAKVEKKLKLVIEGVGMSEVDNSKVDYLKGTESVFSNYLTVPMDQIKPVDFIRSTILRVKGLAKLQVNNPDSFISVFFWIDQPKPLDATRELPFEVV